MIEKERNRNKVIDTARYNFLEYLALNSITKREWDFIELYINQIFNEEAEKVVIEEKATSNGN